MDLIHTFMNIVVPPSILILIICALPPFLAFKLLSYIKRCICSENVAGKVVLITGAASGIGEQIAYEYARRGALLVLVDICEENLVTVSNKARSIGSPDAITIVADVSKQEDCKQFVTKAVNYYGKLDHLVSNAGIGGHGIIEDVTQFSDFLSIMDVNFWGGVYCIHSAIPHLRKSKGKIVVISSTLGWYPLPYLSIYSASKAALINFCETLRTELGCDIGITIVTPGVIKTRLTQPQESQEYFQLIPAESAERCGKAIVRSACRGDLYLTEPSWLLVLLPIKIVSPEIIEWCNRWIFMLRLNSSEYAHQIKTE